MNQCTRCGGTHAGKDCNAAQRAAVRSAIETVNRAPPELLGEAIDALIEARLALFERKHLER